MTFPSSGMTRWLTTKRPRQDGWLTCHGSEAWTETSTTRTISHAGDVENADMANAERTTHSSPGFTLIELLVVIVIIVVLLALLTGGLMLAMKTAEKSKCLANQRNIAQSLNQYRLDAKGTFPNSVGAS